MSRAMSRKCPQLADLQVQTSLQVLPEGSGSPLCSPISLGQRAFILRLHSKPVAEPDEVYNIFVNVESSSDGCLLEGITVRALLKKGEYLNE